MRNRPSLLLITLQILLSIQLHAQEKESISQPILTIRDSLLHISYHIENSLPDTRYTIHLEITGQDGAEINAQHLRGDVGSGIIGGSSRQVTWDYRADLPEMDQALDVSVRVLGSREDLPRVYGTSSLLVRSLAFPGWGLTAIDSGKPYWILGVAGYGAIVASFSLNQLSQKNYQLYLDETTSEQRTHLFQLQEKQLRRSKICAATAAGIWASSLVWTYIKGRKVQQRTNINASLRIRTGPSNSKPIPELLLVYSF